MDQRSSHIPQRQELDSNEVVEGDYAAETPTVPEDVFNNVKEVIMTYPGGLSRERFRRSYKDIHGVSLNVRELGFNMLEGFLQHLVRVRIIEMRYDANILLMMPGPEVIKDVLSVGQLMDNKVPGPKRRKDVMGLGDKINLQTLPPDVKEGKLLEVIVAEVFTPYRFWIQLKGETSAALETIMDEMEILYDGPDSEQFKIPDSCVVVGLVCASLYGDGNWHRAYVKAMADLSTVEVFYVDYGTAAKEAYQVKKDTLRYLHKKFGDLPGQGIEARLAGIKPEGGLRRFTKETSYRFLQLVRMPPDVVGLVAVVKGLAPKVTLWLVDTSTNDLPEGVAINQVLVDEGLAEPIVTVDDDPSVSQKRPVVNHLVPLRRPVMNFKSNVSEVSTVEITASDSQSCGSKKNEIRELQTKLGMLASSFKSTKHPDVVNQFVKLQLHQQEHAKLKGETNPEDGEKSHPSSGCLTPPRQPDDLEKYKEKLICSMKLPGHNLHKVNIDKTAWMTSSQISQLIPNWKGRDLLSRMLKLKRMSVESLVVTADSDPEAFLALVEGGLVDREVEEVRLFPIKSIPHILNILLPAPASELKQALQNQI